jgi:hypothetical protein
MGRTLSITRPNVGVSAFVSSEVLASDLGAITPAERAKVRLIERWLALALACVSLGAFYFTTKGNHHNFDYTYRMAGAFLHGHIGLTEQPPSWLSEFVPIDGHYYSVFPLGAVLSMLPVALLGKLGVVHAYPARVLASVVAALCVYFFVQLSLVGNSSLSRRILLSLFPIFGTWTWCNLGFGGAWQIALGLALLGETAALYFTLVRSRPLLAGLFFALAFGNRTELIVTAPVFLWFLFHPIKETTKLDRPLRAAAFFLATPVVLLFCTALYNEARFRSAIDFGYAHIPNLLREPWYQHGLFSPRAIPWNSFKMLFEGWTDIGQFPYLLPHAFGCSIFLASPFLFLLFREGGYYPAVCWVTIAVLTVILWCHGNPGGWQFSYRYGMILLPWMFLLIAGNGPRGFSIAEWSLFAISLLLNSIATYQFLWTDRIRP